MFSLIRTAFSLNLFPFRINKMVDSKYSTKIIIEATIENSEMLRLVPKHLKRKKMCKHAFIKS